MPKLTCRCMPRLDGASPTELARIFPEPSVTPALLFLLQESGITGFKLSSIVVFQDAVPILLLPLFETRFDLSAFVEGRLKTVLKVAGRLLPSLFHPRVLSVGSLLGGWSEIGIDPHIDAETHNVAFKMALSALHTLAVEHKSDILACYNFNQYGKLPAALCQEFNRVPYRSCACLAIDFNSIEEYLARLSRGARRDLRRKMRVAPQVRVRGSRTIAPYLERIYRLYLETVARSPMALGTLSLRFFETICEDVPGAEYRLYFVQEELVAFNLLVVQEDRLVDLFFCMDYGLGREYNLYVLSWIENVRTCIEQKIPLYYAGQGTEKTKTHLGATFIPSFMLFRHRNPVLDRLLIWPHAMTGKLLSRLGFWPAQSAAAPLQPIPSPPGRRWPKAG
ncbi:MAG: GNAT family N-acetyltransferase [Desulfuromonadales bacterium]|nr:GNAT family N-acetyltransferase [Desulfuromonadales bacterium]